MSYATIASLLDARGTHVLPALGFSKDALAPHISAETLEYHHGKHHNAYVNKLNAGIKGGEFENASLLEIVKGSKGGIFNNAAQHFNHSFYWECMAPGGGGIDSNLAAAIDKSFGSMDAFKTEFANAAKGHFGSGWCWLHTDGDGLAITTTSDAGCPLTEGQTPVLTCDVWEHAYYVDTRNDRPKYVDQFMGMINWEFASAAYAAR